MMKKVCLIFILSLTAAFAGGYTNSDGSYGTRSGNTIYHSDGSYTTINK
jgi:hypothetical protein